MSGGEVVRGKVVKGKVVKGKLSASLLKLFLEVNKLEDRQNVKMVAFRNVDSSFFPLFPVPLSPVPAGFPYYEQHLCVTTPTEVVCDRLRSTVCRPGRRCFGGPSVLDACARQEHQSTCFTAACTRVRRSGAALLESTLQSTLNCRRHLCRKYTQQACWG